MRYGLDGTKRTDITYRNPETKAIEAIWDFKLGNASLSEQRAKELAEYAAGVAGKTALAPRTPVLEFKVVLVPTVR